MNRPSSAGLVDEGGVLKAHVDGAHPMTSIELSERSSVALPSGRSHSTVHQLLPDVSLMILPVSGGQHLASRTVEPISGVTR